jgi:hypothetical protein
VSVAVSIKVSDGFAIAADSATALSDGTNITNVYNSANKIVNLVKGSPIGLMFWDSGAIGSISLATIAKDLRKELVNGANGFDRTNFTMDDIANRVRDYFYTQRYLAVHPLGGAGPFPSIGLHVCGFGTTDEIGRAFTVTIDSAGQCAAPVENAPGADHHFEAFAMPDPIYRLLAGVSIDLIEFLKTDKGMPEVDAVDLFREYAGALSSKFLSPAMPIMDALDLAEFLVDMTATYYRFAPGHQLVGGPTEVAAITKHEGFKWVKRKLYYHDDLNPNVQ